MIGNQACSRVAKKSEKPEKQFANGWHRFPRISSVWSVACRRSRRRVCRQFFTGTMRNIEHLIGHPRFEWMPHDVTFPHYIEIDQSTVPRASFRRSIFLRDAVHTTETSGHGDINMLDLAKRVGARIFHVSTSKVDGASSIPTNGRLLGQRQTDRSEILLR